MAPLGANLLLVLYSRSSTNSSSSSSSESTGSSSGLAGLRFGDFRVRLVYNEQVIPIPGCSAGLDCDLHTFLRVVVGDKTSRERFKHYCDAHELQPDTALAAGEVVGLIEAQDTLYSGSSGASGTSSSSSSSEGPLLVGSEEQEMEDALKLVTADGLSLLLPASGAEEDIFGRHRLWYQ